MPYTFEKRGRGEPAAADRPHQGEPFFYWPWSRGGPIRSGKPKEREKAWSIKPRSIAGTRSGGIAGNAPTVNSRPALTGFVNGCAWPGISSARPRPTRSGNPDRPPVDDQRPGGRGPAGEPAKNAARERRNPQRAGLPRIAGKNRELSGHKTGAAWGRSSRPKEGQKSGPRATPGPPVTRETPGTPGNGGGRLFYTRGIFGGKRPHRSGGPGGGRQISTRGRGVNRWPPA